MYENNAARSFTVSRPAPEDALRHVSVSPVGWASMHESGAVTTNEAHKLGGFILATRLPPDDT